MSKILKYDHEQMQRALSAVKDSNMSVKAASKHFEVPKTTLYYKVKGKYPEKRQMGPRTHLSEEEERKIVNWMFTSADKGFPVTKSQLIDSIQMYVKKVSRETPFKDGKPGIKWFQLFMKRHPQVSVRMAQNLSRARSSVTEEHLRNWFQGVKAELSNKSDVLEDGTRIFNTDETAIFLAPKGEKALVRRGDKSVYSFTSNDDKECLTCLLGSNAFGKLMPPMIVFKYERIPSVVINELPDDWAFGKSETGWMTSETFFEYISNIFYPWLLKENVKMPIVLFVDGHSSHLTFSLSEFCSNHGIILVALHPNSTHIIQPMDVAIFKPLKQFWKQEVQSFKLKNSGEKLKRENFAPLLKTVLQQLKPESFVNGFRRCGIFPFDENAVNYGKYFKETVNRNIEVTLAVSVEMLRIHFKFLQSEIGDEKIKKFEENDVDTIDQSLYLLWKRIKTNCKFETADNATKTVSVTERIELQNRQAEVGDGTISNDEQEIGQFQDEDTSHNEQSAVEEAKPIEAQHVENGIKGIANVEPVPEGNLNQEIIESPSHIESSYTIADDMPSPFRGSFILPETKLKSVKKRLVREPLPSVVSGEKGKQYFKKKEEERSRKEQEKAERKRKREENKLNREREKENKKAKTADNREKEKANKANANSKKNIRDDSSDSSVEITLESEGEGENWDEQSLDSEDHTSSEDNLKEEDFVIVIYEGKYYPGQIKQINNLESTYLVKAMEKSGLNYKWPEKEDILWYAVDEVVCKIGSPKLINTRGSYFVREMALYSP